MVPVVDVAVREPQSRGVGRHQHLGTKAADLATDLLARGRIDFEEAVRLPEEGHALDAQDRGRGALLPFADGGLRFPAGSGLVGPGRAVRADHVVNLAALTGPLRNRSAAHELGVIGVREEHQGAGKGAHVDPAYRLPPSSMGPGPEKGVHKGPRPADTDPMRSEAPGGNPAGRIVVRFALTSFIVLVLVGVAITQFRTRDLRAREERGAASQAELLATQVIGPALTPELLAHPMTGANYTRVASIVNQAIAADPGVKRVKVRGRTVPCSSRTIRARWDSARRRRTTSRRPSTERSRARSPT